MKLNDLMREASKGPIIGAPKGRQKDSRMGTDDPSKYMRGGEWEAYREPQGIKSKAGKIASGQTKGTTRTKNKKMSEDAQIDKAQTLVSNPDPQQVAQMAQMALQVAKREPLLKGLYDPRGTMWMWVASDDQPQHMEIEGQLIDRYDHPEFEDWYELVAADAEADGLLPRFRKRGQSGSRRGRDQKSALHHGDVDVDVFSRRCGTQNSRAAPGLGTVEWSAPSRPSGFTPRRSQRNYTADRTYQRTRTRSDLGTVRSTTRSETNHALSASLSSFSTAKRR